MAGQLDLFVAPLVPGLAYAERFVEPAEQRLLIRHVDTAGLAPFQFHQWQGKRLTASFGWHYDFGERGLRKGSAMPGWLRPLRERAAAFAGLDPEHLAHALVIRYDPGAGIGWHKDKAAFGHVIGISLGNAARLRLRRRTATGFRRESLLLQPGSIYHLAGEARHEWEHSIAPMAAPRWSITFRSLV